MSGPNRAAIVKLTLSAVSTIPRSKLHSVGELEKTRLMIVQKAPDMSPPPTIDPGRSAGPPSTALIRAK
eukprot:9499529-Pyramimonas_sp.AAC.1